MILQALVSKLAESEDLDIEVMGSLNKRIKEQEAQFKAVEQLPEKWRKESGHEESERASWAINIRADELESTLKANQR